MSETYFIDPGHLAQALGGEARGATVTAPGPNNIDRRNDRSMEVLVDPHAPDGFVVRSYSGKNTWQECRDYVRRHAGLSEWKPTTVHSDAPKPKPKVVCHYEYQDETGEPYLRVTRMSDKSFRQSHWDIDGWANGKPSGAVVPYRLPELIARPNEKIWLVEGEKDADNLAALGLLATTAPGGGGNFPLTPDFGRWFDGREVVAIADNDATGARWRDRVSQAVADVVHISMPAPHKDVSDWLQAGGTLDDLHDLVTYRSEAEPTPQPTAEPSLKATPFVWADPNDIPRRPRLYGDHLFRKFSSLVVSPGGIGKSSLVLVEALAMTSGRALLVDDLIKTPEPLTVWYWNGEDPQEETQRRVVAAAKHHGIKPSDFASRLYTDTGRETQITLGQIARGEITLDETLFEALETEILARGIDVFILDPFVSSHRMGENDNNAIDAIVKRLNRLADRCNCAVELVHHVRKPSSGAKEQTDVNDARGASALLGAVRSARVLNVMSPELAEAAGVDLNDRFSYFSVSNGKSNMTKRSGDLKWRHLHDFDLCNGSVEESDHVGVVEHFKAPDTMARLPDNAVEIVQDIARRNDHGRLSPRSPDWFGHLIARHIGMDSEDKNQKEAIRVMINKWIQSGVLEIRQGEDKSRQMRDFITVAGASADAVYSAAEPFDDVPF